MRLLGPSCASDASGTAFDAVARLELCPSTSPEASDRDRQIDLGV
ncbi:hypothetical protein APR12_004824 [Nocardia amikacinitolerans]|nr:hypothetical protein [Nocardia amikacinitolerans]